MDEAGRAADVCKERGQLRRNYGDGAGAPLTILVTDKIDAAKDIHAERFDVSPRLDDDARRRWWSAVADAAEGTLASGDLTTLDPHGEVPITLHFADGSSLTVQFQVRTSAAASPRG